MKEVGIMDEYEKMLAIIESYQNKEEVPFSSEVVSAYTLREILKNKLKELQDLFGSSQTEKFNNNKTSLRHFGKSMRRQGFYAPMGLKCERLSLANDGNRSTIYFLFKKGSWSLDLTFGIAKDNGSDAIYFVSQFVSKEFVQENYDEISSIFSTLEEFSDLFSSFGGQIHPLGYRQSTEITANDDFFKATISYDNGGNVRSTVKLNVESDILERKWLDRKSLDDVLKENHDEILKTIPVEIKSLDSTTKKIVGNALQCQVVPQYVKKA